MEAKSFKKENNPKPSKLWHLNFILLWQGQLISNYGNSIYKIALGFWILAKTGSVGLMGVLMAAMNLPNILVSPIAGAIIDRHNKKHILVLTDTLSGVTTLLLGTLAILNLLEVWMLLVGGMILGICSSMFRPAVHATLPSILEKQHLVRGNAAMSIATTGTDILGKSTGGFLLPLLGAPVLFIINGVSFILSAFSESFIKVPLRRDLNNPKHILHDIKEGYHYVMESAGIKYMLSLFAIQNFFAIMGLTLLLPLFSSKDYLGPEKYGLTMGILSTGMFITYSVFSIKEIKGIKRSQLFFGSGIISGIALVLLPLTSNYFLITVLIFINGILYAIVSMLLKATMQTAVPKHMLGKTSGFERAISFSLMPLAMMIGGFLGEFFPIEYIISIDFLIITVIFAFVSRCQSIVQLLDH